VDQVDIVTRNISVAPGSPKCTGAFRADQFRHQAFDLSRGLDVAAELPHISLRYPPVIQIDPAKMNLAILSIDNLLSFRVCILAVCNGAG
jgi:hypothetical protein